jgi:hypothetical protein
VPTTRSLSGSAFHLLRAELHDHGRPTLAAAKRLTALAGGE